MGTTEREEEGDIFTERKRGWEGSETIKESQTLGVRAPRVASLRQQEKREVGKTCYEDRPTEGGGGPKRGENKSCRN